MSEKPDVPILRVENLFHQGLKEVCAALDHELSDEHQLRHWKAARFFITMATIEATSRSEGDNNPHTPRQLNRLHVEEIRQYLADLYETAGRTSRP